MKQWLNILIIVCVLLAACSVRASNRPSSRKPPKEKPWKNYDEDEINKMRYRGFLKIKTIDILSQVYIEFNNYVDNATEEAKKIGIDENELTDYLKLIIKNNFASIRMERPDFDKYTRKQVGVLVFRVMVTGDNFPIVYHLRCRFQHLDYAQGDAVIWEAEKLGYGSKDNVLDTIKKSIDRQVEELAILFYKVRGEL